MECCVSKSGNDEINNNVTILDDDAEDKDEDEADDDGSSPELALVSALSISSRMMSELLESTVIYFTAIFEFGVEC